MKSYINDSLKIKINAKKKITMKRKNNSLIINNKDIYIDKTNYNKNTKKIIKSQFNTTKAAKNNNIVKKTFNSKFNYNIKKTSESNKNNNNLQTINTIQIKPFNNKNITPPKQTKIRIIKKKSHSKQRNSSCINNNIKNKNNNNKLIKVNNFSISTGLSSGSWNKDKNLDKKFFDSEENNRNINNFNYNADSHSNKLEKILFEEKNNVNNFCYETISKEDSHENDEKIILKCDNYSMLTFGNSFSYSNSQKRKTNKKFLNNENNKSNNDKNINIDEIRENNYMNKLKEENETLKKELIESAQQISFLMHQIQNLKDNTYFPIKKNNKKFKHSNMSVKVNKTKESNESKIKKYIIKKSKLNNDFNNVESNNNNKKIFKNNSLIIKRRKNNDIKDKANINKKINKMKNSMKAFPK